MGTFETECRYRNERIGMGNEYSEDGKWRSYDGNYGEYIHDYRPKEPITKNCIFCGSEIYLVEGSSDKWIPYNMDDNLWHFCKRSRPKKWQT